jgi:hypothetical protein
MFSAHAVLEPFCHLFGKMKKLKQRLSFGVHSVSGSSSGLWAVATPAK